MKESRTLGVLLVCHLVLLTLASTKFSVISWVWGDAAWNWNYFQYSYRNGWGYDYVSDYSLAQVLFYIVAYGLGIAAFGIAWTRYRLRLGAVATVLCVAGALSFCIEGSHWLWRHHLSWIASFPAVMVVLWICTVWQITRVRGAQAPAGSDAGDGI